MVGQREHGVHVVLYQQDGVVFFEAQQQLHHALGLGLAHARQRLVEQQHAGLGGQGHGDFELALLAVAGGPGLGVAAVLQASQFHRAFGPSIHGLHSGRSLQPAQWVERRGLHTRLRGQAHVVPHREGGEDVGFLAHIAFDRVGALHQQQARVVALHSVHVGLHFESLGVVQAELFVALGFDAITIVQGGQNAVCRWACGVQHAFGQEARAVQRDLALEACSGVVTQELGRAATCKEAGHSVGLECGDFSQQRLEFDVGEGQAQFFDDGAARFGVALFEALKGFVARRIFPGDPDRLFVAALDHGLAQRHGGLAVGEAGAEHVGGALGAGGDVHARDGARSRL